jgi:hypothetical protein
LKEKKKETKEKKKRKRTEETKGQEQTKQSSVFLIRQTDLWVPAFSFL